MGEGGGFAWLIFEIGPSGWRGKAVFFLQEPLNISIGLVVGGLKDIWFYLNFCIFLWLGGDSSSIFKDLTNIKLGEISRV